MPGPSGPKLGGPAELEKAAKLVEAAVEHFADRGSALNEIAFEIRGDGKLCGGYGETGAYLLERAVGPHRIRRDGTLTQLTGCVLGSPRSFTAHDSTYTTSWVRASVHAWDREHEPTSEVGWALLSGIVSVATAGSALARHCGCQYAQQHRQ
jgi:hypothetical protein